MSNNRKHRRKQSLIVLVIFAIVGSVFLWRSFAANPNLPGDVNNDNKVTITDLSILLSNFGKASSTVDLNGDGQVSITDLSILLTNFGKTVGGNPNPLPTATYPVKVAASKRVLTGQNNTPFFFQADTAWNLPTRLTEAEAIQYFDARKAQGFNTVYTSLVDIEGGEMSETRNRAGALLFNGGNMGSPNNAYFNHIDRLVTLAADRGMQLAIWPAWLQRANRDGNFTNGNATTYGTFLGNRYKNSPNIIWTMGGDFGGKDSCPYSAQTRALATAIKAADPNHLMTFHGGPGTVSTTCHGGDSWLDISGTYWDFQFQNMASAYKVTLQEYNKSPIRPNVMLETGYEGPSPNDDPPDQMYPYEARLQSVFQVLSGAAGFGYGANSTFRMNNANTGANTRTWQATLSSPGAAHQKHIGDFFRARLQSWTTLVPDQSRSVLTGGNGTFGSEAYAVAARTTDGGMVVAYAPTARTLTVDMSKLSGSTTARWYDVTNGQYRAISGSPFANNGSRQFQTPGNNSAGQSDWLLSLETNPAQL